MAKMGMALLDSGSMKESRIPVWEKGKGPSSLRQNQRGPALTHLRQLFQRGERSEMIVPQIAGSLRRLIQARELLDQGMRVCESITKNQIARRTARAKSPDQTRTAILPALVRLAATPHHNATNSITIPRITA